MKALVRSREAAGALVAARTSLDTARAGVTAARRTVDEILVIVNHDGDPARPHGARIGLLIAQAQLNEAVRNSNVAVDPFMAARQSFQDAENSRERTLQDYLECMKDDNPPAGCREAFTAAWNLFMNLKESGGNDKLAHCVAHCYFVKNCGQSVSDAVGYGKEFLDAMAKAIGGKGTGWDTEDVAANNSVFLRLFARPSHRGCPTGSVFLRLFARPPHQGCPTFSWPPNCSASRLFRGQTLSSLSSG